MVSGLWLDHNSESSGWGLCQADVTEMASGQGLSSQSQLADVEASPLLQPAHSVG